MSLSGDGEYNYAHAKDVYRCISKLMTPDRAQPQIEGLCLVRLSLANNRRESELFPILVRFAPFHHHRRRAILLASGNMESMNSLLALCKIENLDVFWFFSPFIV